MNISNDVLPELNVGAVPLGHRTVAGHVAEPLVTVNSSVNEYARDDGALLNVKVLEDVPAVADVTTHVPLYPEGVVPAMTMVDPGVTYMLVGTVTVATVPTLVIDVGTTERPPAAATPLPKSPKPYRPSPKPTGGGIACWPM